VWWFKSVILVTWEVEIGRIIVQSQPEQKVHVTPSHPMTGCSDSESDVIPDMRGSTNRRVVVQVHLGIR
jgi:prephenate dehydrogenase